MLYLLKVYALAASLIFAGAGVIIMSLFMWYEAKAYAEALYKIRKRVASLRTKPSRFANPLAISRVFSRSEARPQSTSHRIQ